LTNKWIQEQQQLAKFHYKPPTQGTINDSPGGFKQIPVRVPENVDATSQQSVSDLANHTQTSHQRSPFEPSRRVSQYLGQLLTNTFERRLHFDISRRGFCAKCKRRLAQTTYVGACPMTKVSLFMCSSLHFCVWHDMYCIY